MARYASPRSPKSKEGKPERPRPYPDPLAQQAPLVSARWLLWSLAGIFGGGLALVYLTLCLLFWQGNWQILFSPVHPVSVLGAAAAGSFRVKEVRFAPNRGGQPTLDGFLIPATDGSAYADRTVLYAQDTTLAGHEHTAPTLGMLHQLGINIFAYDYRGFGQSENVHPSEKLATEDTEAAWQYLVNTRHIATGSIVIYGQGLGASLAAEAAARHPEAAGLILDSPLPTALALLRADPRSRLMPVRLLDHDRFDPTGALAKAKQPKLFLLDSQNAAGKGYAAAAANPKLIVYPGSDPLAKQAALKRFLDEQHAF
jgi:dienelactone hydrolase